MIMGLVEIMNLTIHMVHVWVKGLTDTRGIVITQRHKLIQGISVLVYLVLAEATEMG